MKTLGGALTTSISNEATYLCRIWDLALANGTTLRFTDLTQDVVVGGNTYVADPGITVSALAATAEGGQNASISVNFATSLIDEAAVRRGALDGATFTLRAVVWTNPALGTIPLFVGSLADVEWHDRDAALITIRSNIVGRSNNTAGELYSRTCRARLGDARCKVNLTPLQVSGSVASVSTDGLTITAAALAGSATNFFALGVIEWQTGSNATLIDEVRSNVTGAGTLTLALPARFPILAGDTFIAKPGCNKEPVTCKTKFNNLANFRGEAFAPPPGANPAAKFRDPAVVPAPLVK